MGSMRRRARQIAGAGVRRSRAVLTVGAAVWLLAAAGARGQGVPATPIPQNQSDLSAAPEFIGAPAKAAGVGSPVVPQNPFMAPNGRSNLHDDAYMTNLYTWSGPLGNSMQTLSTFQSADCASLTVDSAGRLVTICVGLEGPRLAMFDPQTLEELAMMTLPPRRPGTGNPFTDFSGGGHFYLAPARPAVIPTTTH